MTANLVSIRIPLLLLTLVLAGCGGQDADPDAGTPPALLPSDSAAELPVPVDNADAPGVPDVDAADLPGPDSADPRVQTPAAGSPEPNGRGPSPLSASPQAPGSAPASAPASQGDAASIFRRASAAYEDVRSLRADFVMRRHVPLLKQTITSRGTLYQRSPDRIALRFTEPAGDVILSDGEYFWMYYPSTDAQQVMQWPAAQAGSSGVDLKAQFVGDPVERFDATLHGTEMVGGSTTNVLTLVPRQRAEYRSLKVWLDARTSLGRRFEITEHNGSIYLFDLDNVQANIPIPDATFRFSPPAGVRIIRAN